MVPHSVNGTYSDGSSQVLWEDGERVFRRGWLLDDSGNGSAVLIVLPAAEHPSRSSLERLTHEYELRHEFDGTWAARPLDLVRDTGRTMLVLEDAGGKPLERLLDVHVRCGHTEKVHAKPGVYFSLFVVAPQEEECNCSCP